MGEEILEDINDDLEEAMEDILDESLDDFSEDVFEEDLDDDFENDDDKKKQSIFKKLLGKISDLFKKILGSKKLIIISVAGLILLLLIVLGGLLLFLSGEEEGLQDLQPNAQVEGSTGLQPGKEEIVFEDIVDLEPFERIALKSSSSMRLVSITMSLELSDHRYRKQVYSLEERIRKIVTDQVSEMTWLELRNPEGKIMLKYNLLKRINSIFPQATIRNIYFTYFVMQ